MLKLMVLLVSVVFSAASGTRARSSPRKAATRRRWHPLTKVAEVEGYSWATTRLLRSWLYQDGVLPHAKVRGVVLVDLDGLDELIEEGRRGGVAK